MARGGLDGEIARLKHRDVRHRRRAVRVLFDTDIPRALEGFVPLLNDKDAWFRSKALEAHRKWAPKQGVGSLRILANHSWLDARRCAANLLDDFSEDTTEIALLLIEDDDLTCTRKAAEALLRGSEAAQYAERFQTHDDSALRRMAVLSQGATPEHRATGLHDESNSVCEAALQAIVDNGEMLSEDSMKEILKRGLKSTSLLSSAVHNAGEVLVEVTKGADGPTMKALVKELRSQCDSLEDTAIQCCLSMNYLQLQADGCKVKRAMKSMHYAGTSFEMSLLMSSNAHAYLSDSLVAVERAKLQKKTAASSPSAVMSCSGFQQRTFLLPRLNLVYEPPILRYPLPHRRNRR